MQSYLTKKLLERNKDEYDFYDVIGDKGKISIQKMEDTLKSSPKIKQDVEQIAILEFVKGNIDRNEIETKIKHIHRL